MEKIHRYIDSILQAFGPLTVFYGRHDIRNRRRLGEELVNIFINGGNKRRYPPGSGERLLYTHWPLRSGTRWRRQLRRQSQVIDGDPPPKENEWKKVPTDNDATKVPVVVFGAAKFGRKTYKGKLGGLADKYRTLLQMAGKARRLILVDMDEYNTSQVSSKCGKKSLCGNEMSMLQETFVPSLKILSPMATDLDSWLDPPPPHSKNVLMFTNEIYWEFGTRRG
ncbi:hypothetical protein DFQ28_002589 [Apophysomyces sp. BC1034]|nr:hypothetical protein DFQ29_002077 [Apophysomyces sp. BC1021]KAG0190042.1 hypothetical protein DFQ28_002589 [Apophysomyces sp. BC1034]